VESNDEPDDEGRIVPPLPPADRLWRHPSELTAAAEARPPLLAGRAWPVAVLAGTIGALLGTGVAYLAVGGQAVTRTEGVAAVERGIVPITSVTVVGQVRPAVDVVALTQRIRPAVVRLTGGSATTRLEGSGVMFRSDGYVLTSADGLAGITSLTAVLADGRRVAGRVIGSDAESGVAVVKLSGTGYNVATLGSTAGLSAGAPVLAVSAASTMTGESSVTQGSVGAVARTVAVAVGRQRVGMIETDAATVPISWGGALLDSDGVVVGITAPAQLDSGVFYAAPIELAYAVANQLIDTGHVTSVWLGIAGRDLDPASAKALGVAGGAVVENVGDPSPAATCGIQVGDVITAIDGRIVSSMGALMVVLRTHSPGQRVLLQVRHGGAEELVSPVLSAPPSPT
jgi:S1-C subfamily serine protease